VSPRKPRQTTTTTLVLEARRKADDFMTVRQLVDVTKRTGNQVSAALHCMRKYSAVDCLASGGHLYWYAQPPESDTRNWTREEVTPELRPRKPRKPRKLKTSTLKGD
jgi:hypothetical protein